MVAAVVVYAAVTWPSGICSTHDLLAQQPPRSGETAVAQSFDAFEPTWFREQRVEANRSGTIDWNRLQINAGPDAVSSSPLPTPSSPTPSLSTPPLPMTPSPTAPSPAFAGAAMAETGIVETAIDNTGSPPQLGFSDPPLLLDPTWKAVGSSELVYDDRYPVPVQRPLIEWGRPYYQDGMLEPGGRIFSEFNLTNPWFLAYGDLRMGVGVGENAAESFSNMAGRLNLDLDFWITSTERFHGFIGPLNNAGQFTQVDFSDGRLDIDAVFNANLVNGFFEGDLGYMLGGITNNPAEFDLPIAAGLVPLLYQNGIWMDDAVTGVAVARNAQHSRLLQWSNFDATAFAIFDQINSPVFGTDNHAGQALGTAWFIEAYGGYIESGYAYVRDRKQQDRSYHNATIAFTRRYFDRISNSVRVIVNAGQDLPEAERSADGGLLILENSWITANPLTVVPYMNLFYGFGRPQSVARGANTGGILRNVGINFETDGLNGYPTLDDSGINTVGGAIGINLLGASIDRQLVLELAALHGHGSDGDRVAKGDQYAVGARYQFPISHHSLLRFDTMYGFRESDFDVCGLRAEYRFKF
jgi:hypothetical protein